MTDQEKRLAKKRGRPATGRGDTIGVRMLPDQIAAVDVWISRQPTSLKRPAAIRALVVKGLRADDG
jgi:hypothetical protein